MRGASLDNHPPARGDPAVRSVGGNRKEHSLFTPNVTRSRSSNHHVRPLGPLIACALFLGAAVHAQPFPSFLLDTTRHIGRDLHGFGWVSLAASGDRGILLRGDGSCLRLSRLTRSMDVVDTIPLDITGSTLTGSNYAPGAACSDSGYAVAWNGVNRSHGWPIEGLWLTLVSNAGNVTNRILLDSVVQVHSLAIAARSDRYVVVYDGWFTSSQSMDVRAIELGLDGTVLHQALVVRAEGTTPSVDSSDVTCGDSAYFAVFRGPYSTSDSIEISGRLIWPENAAADTEVVHISPGAHAFGPKVAFDGVNFWVAWLEETTPSAETVAKVARVTQSGLVLDTGGIVVRSGLRSVALAAARETTLVALHVRGDSIVGMRYDADAQLLDTTPVLLSTHALGRLTAAVTADTFLAVWVDQVEGVTKGTWRLVGRRITASGSMVDPDVRDYAFSASYHRDKHAAIASDGENFLAVWCDERATPNYTASLVGRRFDNQGRFLDEEPFTITDHHANPLWPILSYGAGCYFVCWHESDQDEESTYAMRISREGALMDSVPICVSSTTGANGVAFLPDSMFVVLVHYSAVENPYVVRVRADGHVIDSVPRGLKVRWDPGFGHLHSSVSNIGDTLVMACGMFGQGVIWVGVGLYDPELNQYDSIYWEPPPGRDYAHRTSVACGGGRILVTSEPKPPFSPDFYLLDSAGNVLNDSLPLPNPGMEVHYYSTVWDGANFQCVSTPGPNGASVVGCRITTDGVLLDTPPVRLVAFDSTPTWGSCALATDSSGNVGLMFHGFESQGYMSTRARAAVFPRLTGGIESPRPVADLNRLEVSPNPTTGITWLKLAGSAKETQTITVRDIAGRVRTEVSLSPASADRGRAMLDLRQLPAGVYFLETAGERRSCKLVLARPGGAP